MSHPAVVQVYPGEEFREKLRQLHGVRLVQGDEDGLGVHRQPEGVYGFTYSPAIKDTPLFSRRGQFTFEVLKIKGGEVLLTGFVTPAHAALVRDGRAGDIELFPVPRDAAAELAALPMSLVGHAREHSSRINGALAVRLHAR